MHFVCVCEYLFVYIVLYYFCCHDTALLPDIAGDSGGGLCSMDVMYQAFLYVLQTQEKYQGKDGREE